MIQKIRVDISNIISNLSGQTSKYKRDLGFDVFAYDKTTKILTLDEVIDEEAHFINLFGVCIDLESGNIALGLSPRSNDYILIGNAYDMIKICWFGYKYNSDKIDVDMKYITELLKLDPNYYKNEIIEELKSGFSNTDDNFKKYNSILVNISKAQKRKDKVSNEEEYFDNLISKNSVVPIVAYKLIRTYLDLESVARGYYGAFITEQTDDEIKDNYNTSLKDLLNGKAHNMESLTCKYINEGFPVVFLNALKSYGLDINDRKNLFNKRYRGYYDDLERYTYHEIVDIGMALSSKFYSRNVTKKEYILAYNFMDLLRAVNWEHNAIFALESIIELQSKVIWESLLKKFNIYDILQEQHLSEKEFVLAVDTYRKTILVQIDHGLCYKRIPNINQYKMLTYSVDQLETAGNIFEMTFTLLNKSLKV